jgi:hypothetical protein
MFKYDYLNAFYSINPQRINMINNEGDINDNKINNKNNESHFEITDKISEKEMGDINRDINLTKIKDNLNNDKLNLQTFEEEFKEKIKKEFENIGKKINENIYIESIRNNYKI